MEELTIKLAYDPAHIKEIYYRNGQGSMFTYQPTRKVLTILFIILLLTAIVYFFTYQSPTLRWVSVLGIIALVVAGIKGSKVIGVYQKWKKQTDKYVEDMGRYKSYSIRLTLHAFEMLMDENTFIEKWENIRSLEINDSYIVLYKTADSTYLLPAKSMRQNEFESLKDFIRNKIMASTTDGSKS
jgi:hypothetical protein